MVMSSPTLHVAKLIMRSWLSNQAKKKLKPAAKACRMIHDADVFKDDKTPLQLKGNVLLPERRGEGSVLPKSGASGILNRRVP